MGPRAYIFANKLQHWNLLHRFRRVKIHSKDVKATKLRITPKVQSTRVIIEDRTSKRSARVQEGPINRETATSRVMAVMSKKVQMGTRHGLIEQEASFNGGPRFGKRNKGDLHNELTNFIVEQEEEEGEVNELRQLQLQNKQGVILVLQEGTSGSMGPLILTQLQAGDLSTDEADTAKEQCTDLQPAGRRALMQEI